MNVTAKNFFYKSLDRMGYLASRWMDESEYEDINDYRANLQTFCATNGFPTVTITKMLKRPFGCEFTVGSDKFRFTLKANGVAEYWKIS
jgi:hypothetical protein